MRDQRLHAAIVARDERADKWLLRTRVAVIGYDDMCRNIHTLFNFEPPATEHEIREASLQYVRKISGYTKPSQANEEAFVRAVDDVAAVTARLLRELVTTAPPKDREREAARARARAAERFGVSAA